MPIWKVEFFTAAEADLRSLDQKDRRRVIEKLEWLSTNFDNISPLSLSGKYKEFYKLRVGDLRIFYKVHWKDNQLLICHIARRDKAYK